MNFDEFGTITVGHFSFQSTPGEIPKPVGLTYKNYRDGRIRHLCREELVALEHPPFPIGEGNLVVGYRTFQDLTCHLALGWPLPKNVVDLLFEFRNVTNGVVPAKDCSLAQVLDRIDLDGTKVTEPEELQELLARAGPLCPDEVEKILSHGANRVQAIEQLLSGLVKSLHFDTALIRGRYAKAVAWMEHRGIPIDVEALRRLLKYWEASKEELIRGVDAEFGVYDGTTFKMARFEGYLDRAGIVDWPRTPTGKLKLESKTFEARAKEHPQLRPLYELRTDLAQMRAFNLSVGKDGRNRSQLHPFEAITGRNQPSGSEFIYGPAKYLRNLIRPEPGMGIAYLDWEQQEFAIAAAQSQDPKMLEAYGSGDPHLEFAKQAGAVPDTATKHSHPGARELYKTCNLGVLYGMGARGLAKGISRSESVARDLLQQHHRLYPVFWSWLNKVVEQGRSKRELKTTLDWTLHVGNATKTPTLLNFPMQATAAEMLRIACFLATEREIRVCAPVHDALLIEAPLDKLDEEIERTREAMADASKVLLDDYELRVEAKVFRHPDRYRERAGEEMWNKVWKVIEKLEAREGFDDDR